MNRLHRVVLAICQHRPNADQWIQRPSKYLDCVRHLGLSSVVFKKVPSSVQKTSTSSNQWVTRQINDSYVKRAKRENYRARSAFKLIEIDDRFKILAPGQVVVDCGAAPGSWTQVATARVNARNIDASKAIGKVIAIDLNFLSPVEGAIILSHADFTNPEIQQQVLQHLGGLPVDAVLSDMAGNATGIKQLDNEIITHLVTTALVFALRTLRPGGVFLCKVWDGAECPLLERRILTYFDSLRRIKPDSSRNDSSEVFLLGRGFKGIIESTPPISV